MDHRKFRRWRQVSLGLVVKVLCTYPFLALLATPRSCASVLIQDCVLSHLLFTGGRMSHISVLPQSPMPVGTGQSWKLTCDDFARSSGRQWLPVTGMSSTRLLHLCAQKSCPLSSGAHLSSLQDYTQASSVQATSCGALKAKGIPAAPALLRRPVRALLGLHFSRCVLVHWVS